MKIIDRLKRLRSLRTYTGERVQGNRQEAERLVKVLIDTLEERRRIVITSPISYVDSKHAPSEETEGRLASETHPELWLYNPRFLRETRWDQAYHAYELSGPNLPRTWENCGGNGLLRIFDEDLDLSHEDWDERKAKVKAAKEKLVGYLMELDRKGIAIPNYAGLEKAIDLFRARLEGLHGLKNERFLEALEKEAEHGRGFGVFGDLNNGVDSKVSGQVLDVLGISAPFQVLEQRGLEYRGNFRFSRGNFYLTDIELRLPSEPKFETKGFESRFPWGIQTLEKDLCLASTFSIKRLDLVMEQPDYAHVHVFYDNSRGTLPPSLVLKETEKRGFSFNPRYSHEFRRKEGGLAYGKEVANWLMQNQVKPEPVPA